MFLKLFFFKKTSKKLSDSVFGGNWWKITGNRWKIGGKKWKIGGDRKSVV